MIAKKQTESAYIDTPMLSKTTKKGIRVISEMSTARIIWYVAGRHKYGLSLTINFAFIGFEVWDKLVRFLV
jgi:hypothetical protein